MKNKNIRARISAKLGTGVAAGVLLLLGVAQSAQAQVPPDPASYRTTSYSYYGPADGAKSRKGARLGLKNDSLLTSKYIATSQGSIRAMSPHA